MLSLRFCSAELSYDGQLPVLHDLELHFTAGWTGIVGDNGAGKTTLLRLALGKQWPSKGRVVREPDDGVALLCAQEASSLDASIRALAERDDREARRWTGRLGCYAEQLERWETLSLGERKRWQLAAALASDPDVLALDEPTNHLDREGRKEIAGALRAFRGIGLLVSHDRALLEELCTSTVRVHRGTAAKYSGGYSAAKAQWEAELEARRDARAEAAGKEKKLAKQLDAVRRVEEAASRQMKTSARMKHRNDSDAKSLAAHNIAEWGAASAGRKVTKLRAQVEQAGKATAELRVEKEKGGQLFVDWEAPPRRFLAALAGESVLPGGGIVRYPDKSRESKSHSRPDRSLDGRSNPSIDSSSNSRSDNHLDSRSNSRPHSSLDGRSDRSLDSGLDGRSDRSLDGLPSASPDGASQPLAKDVHLAVARDSRIRIAGPNGAGKTSLLRALLTACTLPADKILWLPQELGEQDSHAALEELRAMGAAERGRVGQIAAALGLDPARALSSPSPSPGEVRKLAIAMGLGRRAWLLVLDEPTNHLDLPSIERLEAALQQYPGALLVVTHDDAFAAQITNETWDAQQIAA